jgi:hypothetical protein
MYMPHCPFIGAAHVFRPHAWSRAAYGAGGNSNVNCEIVIQYMCEDGNAALRDGTPKDGGRPSTTSVRAATRHQRAATGKPEDGRAPRAQRGRPDDPSLPEPSVRSAAASLTASLRRPDTAAPGRSAPAWTDEPTHASWNARAAACAPRVTSVRLHRGGRCRVSLASFARIKRGKVCSERRRNRHDERERQRRQRRALRLPRADRVVPAPPARAPWQSHVCGACSRRGRYVHPARVRLRPELAERRHRECLLTRARRAWQRGFGEELATLHRRNVATQYNAPQHSAACLQLSTTRCNTAPHVCNSGGRPWPGVPQVQQVQAARAQQGPVRR